MSGERLLHPPPPLDPPLLAFCKDIDWITAKYILEETLWYNLCEYLFLLH